DLWVIDRNNQRVLEYLPPFSIGMLATLVIGQTGFTTNSTGLAADKLNNPFGIAFDATGSLYVADSSNNRVLRYIAPFSNGMSANTVFGQMDFVTGTANTSINGLNSPKGVGLDASGNLFVGDTNNNRTLEFIPPFSFGMNASVVLGQSTFNTAAATVTATG